MFGDNNRFVSLFHCAANICISPSITKAKHMADSRFTRLRSRSTKGNTRVGHVTLRICRPDGQMQSVMRDVWPLHGSRESSYALHIPFIMHVLITLVHHRASRARIDWYLWTGSFCRRRRPVDRLCRVCHVLLQ